VPCVEREPQALDAHAAQPYTLSVMSDHLVQVAEGFWNIRGSFKIAGLLDVGTQMSLARCSAGDFVLLDSYTLTDAVAEQVRALTDGGRAVRAVLNLHPFHTLHVSATAGQFPDARLYGTRRHVARFPALRWEPQHSEDPALHALFADDFRFSVPRGVDFVPSNESLHFSSVLALHRASGTLHVDDTLTWLDLPMLGGLKLHPTLRFALQKRPGAAADFRNWAAELLDLSEQAEHLCTAHGRELPNFSARGERVCDHVRGALAEAEKLLAAHQARHG